MKKTLFFTCIVLSVIFTTGCKKADLTHITPPTTSHTDTLKTDSIVTPAGLLANSIINGGAGIETSILKADSLWEAGGIVWCSVHQTGAVVSLYYLCDDAQKSRHLCYAYSNDGFHFVKPNLNQFNFKGSKNNNIIDIYFDSISFFYDETAPANPYKLIGMRHDHKLHTAYSKDGIKFTVDEKPFINYFSDTQNEIIYDAETKKFKCYLRDYVLDKQIVNPLHGIYYYRGVGYYETDSLSEVQISPNAMHHPFSESFYSLTTEFPTILNYDRKGGSADVYTPGVIKYNKNTYIAYPSIFNYYPQPPVGQFFNDGYQSISLYTSADGKNFTLRKANFINHEPASYYIGPGFASKNGKLINYYWKTSTTHGMTQRVSELVAIQYTIETQLLESINAYNNLPN